MSTTMNTNALRLGVSGQSGFRFDNVSVHARALDAAKSTTYAYNTSNQLTSSVTDGVTTSYTYDAWGRLLTRSAGSYTATHTYRYGDKLKHVASSFPGEASSVAMNYDGLGRRRNRMANGVTPITWWRYNLAGSMVTSYVDADLDWAIEGFSEAYVPGFAGLKGIDPTTAVGHYFALDSSNSMRASFGQAKDAKSSIEYYPFGKTYIASGQEADMPIFRDRFSVYDKYVNACLKTSPGNYDDYDNYEDWDPRFAGDWDIEDFLAWYFFEGGGHSVNLNTVGVTERARRQRDVINGVRQQKTTCGNLARQHAREACANTNNGIAPFAFGHFASHFYDMWLEPSVLFVLGRGFMEGRSTCAGVADCCLRTYTYSCSHLFTFDDNFDEILLWALGTAYEPGTPYNMYGYFLEFSSGGGRF